MECVRERGSDSVCVIDRVTVTIREEERGMQEM